LCIIQARVGRLVSLSFGHGQLGSNSSNREVTMKRPPHPADAPHEALRRVALRYPEAEEGVACEGTAAQKRTIKARGKAFLFLGVTEAMLKLRESLAEATDLAAEEPNRYRVGAHGWITITLGDARSPMLERLLRWVDESYRLLAPKQLVTLLPKGSGPPSVATKPAKPKVRTKGPESSGGNKT
jgi:hypothetical protein